MMLLLLLVSMLRAGPAQNLLPGNNAHWEKLVIGAPAEFAIDDKEHHGGHNSLRIDAKENDYGGRYIEHFMLV